VVWVRRLVVRDFRNIREAGLDLHPGLNVLVGRNAQGKTSLLEAVGLLARGRSFRTEDSPQMIRWGAGGLLARAETSGNGRDASLEVELGAGARRFRVDGREVAAAEYRGRLEAVVYAAERLGLVHGPARERRLFLDRGASVLWPSYREVCRAFERVLAQRNAAIEARAKDLPVWDERFAELGARLRLRRAEYAGRLDGALRRGYRPGGEAYEIRIEDAAGADETRERERLLADIEEARRRERVAGRSLVGPQRDRVLLMVDGRDAAAAASSGQVRSLLLALALATLEVHREETGQAAVALLDDLDAELDAERAGQLCRDVSARGQALVTTVHAAWAEAVRPLGRVFEVAGGEVRASGAGARVTNATPA
jgi:DNA replication and repair protein RecF